MRNETIQKIYDNTKSAQDFASVLTVKELHWLTKNYTAKKSEILDSCNFDSCIENIWAGYRIGVRYRNRTVYLDEKQMKKLK